jgi:hypothetical protein
MKGRTDRPLYPPPFFIATLPYRRIPYETEWFTTQIRPYSFFVGSIGQSTTNGHTLIVLTLLFPFLIT